MKGLMCFFVLLIGMATVVFSDIVDDALNSKYTPIIGRVFRKNNFIAIIVRDENGRSTWRDVFSEDTYNKLFKDFLVLPDYLGSVNIPYDNLKNNVLPDYAWFDKERNIYGDSYWDPDIKRFVTYLFEDNNYNLVSLTLINERISENIVEINKQILFLINLLEHNIRNYSYIYMGVEEKVTRGNYTPEIVMSINYDYARYTIWGLDKFIDIYLSDYDHETEWQTYKIYTGEDIDNIIINRFFSDLKNNLISIGFNFDSNGWEVIKFN